MQIDFTIRELERIAYRCPELAPYIKDKLRKHEDDDERLREITARANANAHYIEMENRTTRVERLKNHQLAALRKEAHGLMKLIPTMTDRQKQDLLRLLK